MPLHRNEYHSQTFEVKVKIICVHLCNFNKMILQFEYFPRNTSLTSTYSSYTWNCEILYLIGHHFLLIELKIIENPTWKWILMCIFGYILFKDSFVIYTLYLRWRSCIVGVSASIRSAGNSVPKTLDSNPAFSRGRQLVSFRFENRFLACARASKLTTNMYISPEPDAKTIRQGGRVGWMLADHRDGILSSSFWLDPRWLSRFVSGHSVCWKFGPRDPGFKFCIQQRKTICLLSIWKSLPSLCQSIEINNNRHINTIVFICRRTIRKISRQFLTLYVNGILSSDKKYFNASGTCNLLGTLLFLIDMNDIPQIFLTSPYSKDVVLQHDRFPWAYDLGL